ncbi:hypothetical protein AAG570_007373 [Ranatra chinensis]|uniref:Uncharacterized protein n=1 Tax=Ranatra chinensis TaxID=642074 RepID=A0ABD0XVZ9_9HEMI
MLPSKYLDVVLEDDEQEARNRAKKHEALESEVTILTGADNPPTTNNNNNVSVNKNCNLFEGWDLGKKLPEALLSECTVEICTDPKRKKEAPKLRFEARVTPIYNNSDRRAERSFYSEEGDDDSEEDPHRDAGDDGQEDVMLSEVEAVYSEHESDSELQVSPQSDPPPAPPAVTLEQARPAVTFVQPAFSLNLLRAEPASVNRHLQLSYDINGSINGFPKWVKTDEPEARGDSPR